MKGLFKLIGLALPIFLLLPFFGQNAYAAKTAYKITDATEIGPPIVNSVGQVLLVKIFGITYTSGKMILSSDPEGTQSATIGDTLIVNFTYPATGTFTFESRSKDCKTHIPMPPTDITSHFTTQNNGLNSLTFRYIDWCGGKKQISSLYLVLFDEEPDPSPSPSPTPSPTPQPFLDLPWDYQGKGLNFDQVVFNPNSWFDHQYPLQNFCCDPPVMRFDGEIRTQPYKSHNGYDYGSKHGVFLNTEVLAAASGNASFVSESNSGGAGNVVKIDHGSGYQTWYEHLQKDDHIPVTEGVRVFVNKGQMIGKVGMTGNTNGPHIHFSVFKDINNNDNFDDDIPFGATDPLGWEGENPDPWPTDKNGAESFNLFIARSAPVTNSIPTAGGTLNSGNAQIVVPQGASNNVFSLIFKNGPFEAISNFVKSVSPSFFLNAYAVPGIPLTQFFQPVKIIYNYSESDLSNIKEGTLKLYYFNEQSASWNAIPTLIDTISKTVTGETFHFTQFALMGEVKDTTPPSTEAIVIGEKGQDNWYRTNVSVELKGTDDIEGLGIQYTLYTLNDSDWNEYEDPLMFESEGIHRVTYQSFDKADNQDERKTIEFNIDKTAPEAKIFIDLTKQDLEVEGVDTNQTTVEKIDNGQTRKKNDAYYSITDLAGNTLKLGVIDLDREKLDRFKVNSLQYNNDTELNEPINHVNVIYQGKNDVLNVREQNFEVKGDVKIRIKYDPKTNTSTIITKEFGEEKVKETKAGLILLQLVTNQGNLEYSNQ